MSLRHLPTWAALSLLAGLVLAMFSDVLFFHPKRVLSNGSMDLYYFFIHWRYFGFGELKAGRLALWNPHYYSGAPFFGGFQAGLLYPLNFLYLLLPLEKAINWTIALHVFLAGAFTFFWTRHRGLHPGAGMLAAMMFMFCGPHFLHIYAGHLPNLCTMIWAPLLFLAIDQLFDRLSLPPSGSAGAAPPDALTLSRPAASDPVGRGSSRASRSHALTFSRSAASDPPAPKAFGAARAAPCLLGGFAVAMAVLAGHPQYVFFLGVAAGVYCVLNLLGARQRLKLCGGLALICLWAIGLSAVQLFTGLQETSESMRSLGLSYSFASEFSFPPENFLTLAAPWCFGDMQDCLYWGRWHLSETSLFVSVTGLVLALYGAARGQPATRRFSVCLLLVVLILALGSYTPLFPFLYHHVPGFNRFRGFAKFNWLSALFLAMLAAIGWDALLKQQRTPRWLMAVSIGSALALGLMALWLPHASWWPGLLKAIRDTHQQKLPRLVVEVPSFIAQANRQAVQSLIVGAVSFATLALLLIASNFSRAAAGAGIVILAAVELCAFAAHSLATFQIPPPYPRQVEKLLQEHPGDYRILTSNPNSAMTAGTEDIWGDDPAGLLRYARFLAFTIGNDYDALTHPTRPTPTTQPAWALLRCRFHFIEGSQAVSEIPDPLPRLLLVDRCRILTNRHEILSTLTNSAFPRRQEVILESRPEPWPQPATQPGMVRLLGSTTGTLTIEATVGAPTLLFITDAYSKLWRAFPLPGSSQRHYEILPADYCLRAIPLAAGHHLLALEYSPLAFRIGKWVSLASLGLFIGCLVRVCARSARASRPR